MAERTFTVWGKLSTEVGEWLVSTDVTVSSPTMTGLRQQLSTAVMGLHQFGLRPEDAKGQRPEPTKPETGNYSMLSISGLPIPHCPVHREGMAESKFKRKDGWQGFICTRQDHGVYCKHMAAVNPSDHETKYWEKKQK